MMNTTDLSDTSKNVPGAAHSRKIARIELARACASPQACVRDSHLAERSTLVEDMENTACHLRRTLAHTMPGGASRHARWGMGSSPLEQATRADPSV